MSAPATGAGAAVAAAALSFVQQQLLRVPPPQLHLTTTNAAAAAAAAATLLFSPAPSSYPPTTPLLRAYRLLGSATLVREGRLPEAPWRKVPKDFLLWMCSVAMVSGSRYKSHDATKVERSCFRMLRVGGTFSRFWPQILQVDACALGAERQRS